jgi:hypothetical protein
MKPFWLKRPINVPNWDHFAHQQWYDEVARFTRSITRVTEVTEDYTVEPEYYWIRVDASSGAITITLPPVGSLGRPIGIMKSDSSVNAVTVDGNGSETIEGSTTQSLTAQYDAILLRDNGTSWDVELRNSSVLTTIINDGGVGGGEASDPHWEPMTNGDPTNPEFMFIDGDVAMVWVM